MLDLVQQQLPKPIKFARAIRERVREGAAIARSEPHNEDMNSLS